MNKLLTLSGLLAAAILPAQEVKLNNPSFESGTGGYWINNSSAARVDTAESSAGQKSLSITPPSGKTVSVVFNTPYKPDTVYELSFDAKTSAPDNPPQLTLRIMLQGQKPICFYQNKKQTAALAVPAKLTGNWQTLKYKIGPVPPKAMGKEVRRLMFYINTKGTAEGKVWIDNLKLNTVTSETAKPAETAPAKQPVAFFFPGPVQIYEDAPEVRIKAETGSGILNVKATDAFGRVVLEQKGKPGEDSLTLRFPGPDYYKLTAEVIHNGKSVAKRETSLLLTTPLPDDYYSTPHPAFGVWGGLTARLRRLGGAKWDRQLFFTHFQKKDAKPVPPTAEQIANREPVRIIRCMNILNPFKRMVPVPPADRAKLAGQLAVEVASKRGLVDVWETQNEPMVGENFHGTMNDVMDIIKLESEVVRKQDPGRTIAGICINPMSANQYAQYIGYYKKYGIAKYIDAIMLHPYIPGAQNPDASGYAETLNRLQKELHEISGRSIPMYISEIGYSTKPGGEITELQQAAYLARVVILNRTIKELKACVWHIGLWNDATSQRELDFGLLRKHPKKSPVREPKPAFAAWATVSRMTYDAELVQELNIGRKLRVWLFNKRGTPMLIAYSLLPEPVDFQIVMNTPEVKVTEVCGKTSVRKLNDGVLKLRLTEAPVYIVGGNLDDFTGNKFNAEFSPENPSVVPGSAQTVKVRLPEGLASPTCKLSVQSDLPLTSRITGSGREWNVTLEAPARMLPGDGEIFFRLEDNGSGKYIWQKTLTVKPPAELTDVVPLANGSDPMIRGKLVRHSSASGSSFVLEILENDQVVSISRAAADKPVTATLLNTRNGRRNRYTARLTAADGFRWTQNLPQGIVPVKIPFLGNGLDTPSSAWPAAGCYDIANGMESVHGLKGKFDRPSGTIRLGYDNTNLYFAIDVRDNDFHPSKSAASLWDGDSLQIGISVPQKDMIRPNNDGIQETAYAEFGVKAGTAGQDSWVWASMNLNNMPLHQPVPGIVTGNSRKNGVTLYRFSIPWKTLNIKPSKGMTMGISILINDRDPAGRHWVEWFSGIANGKEPSAYGTAILQ